MPREARHSTRSNRFPPGSTRCTCSAGQRAGRSTFANFRKREWGPAIESAGVATPARLYDLRSTFASNALAAGITVFELARIMGTSVGMIERHYGALLDTAHTSLLDRLEAHHGAAEAAEGGTR